MPKIVDSEQRRTELGQAAARVIARSGIAGASMREVAAEAGWTTGALVHYFRNKRELLQFTLEASLEQRSRGPAPEPREPADELADVLRRALPVDDDSRLHWIVTVAFCAQAEAEAELARIQRDAYRRFRSHVETLVVAAGLASDDDALATAERLIATTDGVAMQALFDPASWPASRQQSMVADAIAAAAAGPGSKARAAD